MSCCHNFFIAKGCSPEGWRQVGGEGTSCLELLGMNQDLSISCQFDTFFSSRAVGAGAGLKFALISGL